MFLNTWYFSVLVESKNLHHQVAFYKQVGCYPAAEWGDSVGDSLIIFVFFSLGKVSLENGGVLRVVSVQVRYWIYEIRKKPFVNALRREI